MPYGALTEKFLLYLAAERGLSLNYREGVRRSLARFARWCTERELAPADITEPLLAEYSRYLHSEGLQPSSCRIALVHLRRFFRYLSSRNILPLNPAEFIKNRLPETGILLSRPPIFSISREPVAFWTEPARRKSPPLSRA